MDKIAQVIDMVEHPDRYSDAQMEEILQDEESLQAYLSMVETRMAFDKKATEETFDIDKEWKMFTEKHSIKPIRFGWTKVAASLVGVVMLSGIAFAAIHTFSSHHQTAEVVASDSVKAVVAPRDSAVSAKAKTEVPEKKAEIIHKTFDNVSLENMFGEMAKYYGVKVVFRNAEAKQLRFYYEWNSENSLQQVVDELNNSQQMNISLENDELVIE